jgi:hypothetical protein
MYSFENWLVHNFPIPKANHLKRFEIAFPKAPEVVIEFFSRRRGGEFTRAVEVINGASIEQSFAINSSWPNSDLFHKHRAVVSERRKNHVTSELFEIGPDEALIPLFSDFGQINYFFDCNKGKVLFENGEVGGVTYVADSLGEFLEFLLLTEPFDCEKQSEIDHLIAICDDDSILALSAEKLREFRSSTYHDDQFNILHRSIVDDRWYLVEELLKRSFGAAETDARENTSLHIAARFGAIESLKVLTKSNHDLLNFENSEGKTPFEVAVERNTDNSARCAIWLAHCGSNLKQSGDQLFEYIRNSRYENYPRRTDVSEKIIGFLKENKYADDIES